MSDTDIQQRIRDEVAALRPYADAFGVERLRDGSWFNEFIRAMLQQHVAEVEAGGGMAFYTTRYPGLSHTEIMDRLTNDATTAATWAGGASGVATTVTLAAAFATAGVSLLAAPAVASAVIAELLYTALLQVRLVYDLARLHDYPIHIDAPEDLYKIFALTYGVVYTDDLPAAAVTQLSPESARSFVRALVHDNAAAVHQEAMQRMGPELGRGIVWRSLMSNVVPVVGSAGWNYVATMHMADVARRELRALSSLRNAALELVQSVPAGEGALLLAVEAMLVVVTADNQFDAHEQEVFRWIVRSIELPPDVEAQIDAWPVTLDVAALAAQIAARNDPAWKARLAASLLLAAAADGTSVESEQAALAELLAACGHPLDPAVLAERVALFSRPPTVTEQAGESLMQASGDAARGIVNTGRALGMATWALDRKSVV